MVGVHFLVCFPLGDAVDDQNMSLYLAAIAGRVSSSISNHPAAAVGRHLPASFPLVPGRIQLLFGQGPTQLLTGFRIQSVSAEYVSSL